MRLKVIRLIYFSVIFIIILRLGYWQIIKADELTLLAEKQRTSQTQIEASRGKILFSDNTTLVSSQPVYLLFAQPKLIQDKDKFADTLGRAFWEEDSEQSLSVSEEVVDATAPAQLTQETAQDKLKKTQDKIFNSISKDLFWVSLGRRVSAQEKDKLSKLSLKGLGFEQHETRFYPEGSSSAHLLGFVGSDIYGINTGYFGLEGQYNGELRGRDGLLKEEKDAQGLPILIGDFIAIEPKQGKNLTLNIDRAIQHIIEQKLKDGIEKYRAKAGSVVVMDPRTGNILSMASYPNYDPANPSEFPAETYKNPIIADGYEPGSTLKVLIVAAALNEGVITPETICDSCSGPLNIGGFSIRTWDNQYRPNSTMSEVIIHSDNTGMVFIAKKLGLEKLYKYVTGLGFGDLTNIDLQDERSPDLRPKDSWKDIDLATSSFGQGIAVTMIQMVKAVGAIANQGKLMEPHVVKFIEDENGKFVIEPRQISQPISAQTAKKVTDMMVQAVDKGESQYYKKAAGLTNYKIAGKTGTAQIPVAGHYDPTKTIASFIGFAPADDPKFIMLVSYQEPSAAIFGAETAAPTFFDIAKELFLHYGIAPEE